MAKPDPLEAARVRGVLRAGLIPRITPAIAVARAYLDLLRNLCLLDWDKLGGPIGAELVGVLREKWEAELKAARGSASASMRKAVAQGAELANLQAAHMRLRKNLTTVQEERDEIKALLLEVAPTTHYHWMRSKLDRAAHGVPATDIPQTHETHGD